MLRVWVNQLVFNDNTIVDIDKDDIIVIVGANNSGKSATLRELGALIQNSVNLSKIVKGLKICKEGTDAEFTQYLQAHSKLIDSSYRGYKLNMNAPSALNAWKYPNGLGDYYNFFVNTLSTTERISAANPPSNIRLTTDPPQHPIHFLQKSDSVENQFNKYFRQAFGIDLVVHRNAGNNVPLYIGEKPSTLAGEDRVSESYLNRLEQLSPLQNQGDGMRSFVGVLLNAFLSQHNILLIDEPEAFLHPPQARLLGKMLAKDLPNGKQLFLATHDEDFLKGLLDANSKSLKVLRIQRDGNVNNVSVLNNLDIADIWKDSLLRHSNVLSGLFHTKVVLCESDSDCRFFTALMTVQYETEGTIAPDILFIHCGGKQRMPVVIKALKKLNVPTTVISDFDLLNNINPIKQIYEDLGGQWDDIEKDWKIVKAEIEKKRPEFLTTDLRSEIDSIFNETPDRIFPKEKAKRIENALKKASPWTEAKEVGKAYIPSGDASKSYEKINAKFKEKGLHILEVGELESFYKKVGGHGPKWVNEVLERDLLNDPDLESARRFVKEIVS